MMRYKQLCLLLWLVLATCAFADDKEKTDFIVNDDGQSYTQKDPRIAVTGDGSFIIVWTDNRNGDYDLYMQRYDENGSAVGINALINDDTVDQYQLQPALAVDWYNRYATVWKDYRVTGYPYQPDLFFQQLDSNGTLIGSNFNITTEQTESFKENPDIALAHWGGGVIVWSDYRNSKWDIYGQRINSANQLVGSNFIVNDLSSTAQHHSPKAIISSEGWMIVTWYDNRNGNDDIYIQKIDSLGNLIGGNVMVNETSSAKQSFPDVAIDDRGNFTVVWVDWRNGEYPDNPDIYSRKFDEDLNPLTDEINISEGKSTAQKDPVISSDHLGNVAIIWSDSTVGGGWDIIGQMIDVDGVIREASFYANTDTDSNQFTPDVALDGKYRYLTWVDRRNKNFDIYASIQIYNDPSLSVTPTSLKFEMIQGGDAPANQDLIVAHNGYSILNYSTTITDSWLSLTPSSGTTVDTITAAIGNPNLPEGTYLSTINFVDEVGYDSSVFIPVRLNVYQPEVVCSKDTIEITVFAGGNDNYYDSFVIQNGSKGDFTWSASESADWLVLSNYVGAVDDTITLAVNGSTIPVGTTIAPIVISAPTTSNLEDTVFVIIEGINDQPYLLADLDSIFIYTDDINFDTTLTISNPGNGALNWEATSAESWLSLSPATGSDDQAITLSLSSPTIGYEQTTITIVDTTAFNDSITVPVVLGYYQTSNDTLRATDVTADVGMVSSFSIELGSVNYLTDFYLPLQFDTATITVDSVKNSLSYPATLTLSTTIDNDKGQLFLDWTTVGGDSIPPGSAHLAEVYFTAGITPDTSDVDTLITDTAAMNIITPALAVYTPIFEKGVITLSIITGIIDHNPDNLPGQFALEQNYPNPFNATTQIEYELPSSGFVSLAIYNILGQKITDLFSGRQEAGRHRFEWNGKLDRGEPAPSGIYFYKLVFDRQTSVRKMMLIK